MARRRQSVILFLTFTSWVMMASQLCATAFVPCQARGHSLPQTQQNMKACRVTRTTQPEVHDQPHGQSFEALGKVAPALVWVTAGASCKANGPESPVLIRATLGHNCQWRAALLPQLLSLTLPGFWCMRFLAAASWSLIACNMSPQNTGVVLIVLLVLILACLAFGQSTVLYQACKNGQALTRATMGKLDDINQFVQPSCCIAGGAGGAVAAWLAGVFWQT